MLRPEVETVVVPSPLALTPSVTARVVSAAVSHASFTLGLVALTDRCTCAGGQGGGGDGRAGLEGEGAAAAARRLA